MENSSSPLGKLRDSEVSEFEQFKVNTTNTLIAGAVSIVVTQPFHGEFHYRLKSRQ